MSAALKPFTLLEQALELAATGLPVFPCGANKRPCIPKDEGGNGHDDATTDPAKVRELFAHRSARLIGVPTGKRSGFDILDLDYRNGAEEWEEQHVNLLPETRTHQSKSGGRHLVLRHHPGLRNSASKIGPGVDVRAEGGYACWPPSPGYSVIHDAEAADWPEWLLKLARKPEPVPARPVTVPAEPISSRRLQAFIDKQLGHVRGAPDGMKHDTLLRSGRAIGGVVEQAGLSADGAIGLLVAALPPSVLDWNSARQTAAWAVAEGRKAPLQLEDRPGPGQRQHSTGTISPPEPTPHPGPVDVAPQVQPTSLPTDTGLEFDADEWDEGTLPVRPWVSPGYLLRQAVTVLVGAGAAGKSSLMIAWTVALARNQSFHRMTPRHACRVLIFNAEDGPDEQKLRFSAALRSFNATPTDLKGLVLRVSTTKLGRLVGPVDGVIGFLPAMQKLEQQIAEFKPDVVMLDPMIELHAADENDNGGIREVMSHFRTLAVRYNLALVIAHHTRKGAIIPGDPDGARGASAIVGAARIVMTAVTMSEPEAEAFGISEKTRKSYFRLDGAKSNHAALQEAEWFEKVPHQLANGEWAVTVTPWDAPEDVIDLDTRNAIIAGAEAGSSEGPWSPRIGSDARSIRQLFVRHGVTTKKGQVALLNEAMTSLGFTIATFRRAKDRVKAQGLRSKNGLPDNVRWLEDEELE